ncbi:hypothetical protein LCM10_12300 [Rossellomorea aquimaris]|uniref:hypothetical protein n=1 Tax=Rossellomorea aquimaris TaxID=189382 RepID=UPI001CD8042F|nr:hypothetical protein [Rossellomorea aquimaris]MCA1055769.1 hypothetical protein [Rossellomorea aquimaris]
MLLWAFANIFIGISCIVLVSKLWERAEVWISGKYGGRYHPAILVLFLSFILLVAIIFCDLLIAYTFHYTILNTLFVTSFFLMIINIFGPYYSSHMINEERIFMRYAFKFSKDETIKVFQLPITPFFLASVVVIMITAILTMEAM